MVDYGHVILSFVAFNYTEVESVDTEFAVNFFERELRIYHCDIWVSGFVGCQSVWILDFFILVIRNISDVL
jgi:hypothetical protein